MPGAWNDDDRQRAEDGYDAPPGSSAAEELAHEIALAAALDRSRPSLSPDPQASARMRQRLVEAMAEQGMGRAGQIRAGQQDAGRPPVPAPGPSELTAPLGAPIARTSPSGDAGPLTEPVGRPVPDLEPAAPAASAASVGRAAGEHTLPGTGAGSPRSAGRTQALRADRRTGRARHVLPDDHPDQATSGSRPATGRPAGRSSGRRRPSLRKRFGIVVTAVAALAVLAGIAATASRDALPGDALYGVKRVTESTGGVFTFGDQAEAARQLGLARTRVDELESLMGRGTPPDASTITSAIDDFDRATSNGSRLMLAEDGTGSQLGDLRTWATAQSGRMEQLRASMPQDSVPEADDSIALLDRVLTRTEALRARTGCTDPGSGSVDDLGPLPSSGTCVPQPGEVPAQTAPESGPSEPGTGSSAPESSSGSTDPGTPSSPTSSSPEPGVAPLIGGDSASSQSGEPTSPTSSSGDTSTSTTDAPAPLLGPITLPPLLPGLAPVTIG